MTNWIIIIIIIIYPAMVTEASGVRNTSVQFGV